ncbi:hypothetical protein FF38_01570 [Lucilia cuprina]|uniref:Uncharacterized protein n=1 Tax=Lucilia cuprina TaxID=7375 RepID=A0A0L0CF28_LUCCU|nr:hypothetical protein FF38_01570 [Lucilia cuprina]
MDVDDCDEVAIVVLLKLDEAADEVTAAEDKLLLREKFCSRPGGGRTKPLAGDEEFGLKLHYIEEDDDDEVTGEVVFNGRGNCIVMALCMGSQTGVEEGDLRDPMGPKSVTGFFGRFGVKAAVISEFSKPFGECDIRSNNDPCCFIEVGDDEAE